RSGRPVDRGSRGLAPAGQVVEVVRGDRALGQLEDVAHRLGVRDALAVLPAGDRRLRLRMAQLAAELRLAKLALSAPLLERGKQDIPLRYVPATRCSVWWIYSGSAYIASVFFAEFIPQPRSRINTVSATVSPMRGRTLTPIVNAPNRIQELRLERGWSAAEL